MTKTLFNKKMICKEFLYFFKCLQIKTIEVTAIRKSNDIK